MPCWPRGVKRSPGCDAAGGPASNQANAGRRHDTTAARRDLDIGGWRCSRASDGDGFWRDWGAWPSYQFRMAFVVVGDDVPAIWKHADAAGGGQVAAQSTFGAGERKLINDEVCRSGAKAIVGYARRFRPTYAWANVGHPSDSSHRCYSRNTTASVVGLREQRRVASSAMLLPYPKAKECHAKER
jgi:hypothetical protein